MPEIVIKPIARIINSVDDPMEMPPGGVESVIEVKDQYMAGLLGIEQNSHIWILSWFHKANRQVLQTVPARISRDLPHYGVFALRSPVRPNPIGLSITQLINVEGNRLYVKKLDVINNTEVLDIKPYIENDSIFSPRTPYLKAENREKRYNFYIRQARNHHQEECQHLYAAARMALIAEDYLGQVNDPGVVLYVEGPLCLADCLQGISRARFANPEGFHFKLSPDCSLSIWKNEKGGVVIKKRCEASPSQYLDASDQELFEISYI